MASQYFANVLIDFCSTEGMARHPDTAVQTSYVTEGQFRASHAKAVPEEEVDLDERAKAHLPSPPGTCFTNFAFSQCVFLVL